MSNCKFETSNGRCGLKGCYAYRRKCFTEDLCKCHEPKTNADRIRNWNDHKLAETIADFVSEIDNGEVRYSDDPNDWLKWLQQPSK